MTAGTASTTKKMPLYILVSYPDLTHHRESHKITMSSDIKPFPISGKVGLGTRLYSSRRMCKMMAMLPIPPVKDIFN